MADGGEEEARQVAEDNAKMLGHVARYPRVRDRALFIGEPEDVVAERFGDGLPEIREWTRRHFDFVGAIPGGGGAGTAVADCILAHEIDSLPEGREIAGGVPAFVQAPEDYHLTEVSPAIDRCDDALAGGEPDLDMASRGVDADVPTRFPAPGSTSEPTRSAEGRCSFGMASSPATPAPGRRRREVPDEGSAPLRRLLRPPVEWPAPPASDPVAPVPGGAGCERRRRR